MTDLKTLTIQDFEKLVDTAFEVRSAEAGLQLSLVEVKAMGAGARDGGAFSVLLQGPPEPVLEQSIYTLFQPDLGEQDLFLVPVAEKDAGIQYEAVFT
ncbi:DUF6916 family protein [Roseibium sediminicola]|uniref:DUF6916 domain-containing protein n=1 Tax=Roseibium sediminicola TaxID=2933272 RepID=A0ABT0GXT2_9HYPH|nr:hypothetical protein [Roseibium sp. CAU 1639]MCK7613618.1 hypothetical protein [Roseibium sp. CAU 1639]